jgi:hypothetical protein
MILRRRGITQKKACNNTEVTLLIYRSCGQSDSEEAHNLYSSNERGFLDREHVPTFLGGVRNAYKFFVRTLNEKTRSKNLQGDITVFLKMSGVIWLRKGTSRGPL